LLLTEQIKKPLCLKNVTTLIVNNFYTLEPVLIHFGTLYAETLASKHM